MYYLLIICILLITISFSLYVNNYNNINRLFSTYVKFVGFVFGIGIFIISCCCCCLLLFSFVPSILEFCFNPLKLNRQRHDMIIVDDGIHNSYTVNRVKQYQMQLHRIAVNKSFGMQRDLIIKQKPTYHFAKQNVTTMRNLVFGIMTVRMFVPK